MNSLVLVLIAAVGYIIAYRTYGRFIGYKLFEISKKNVMPSHELNDGIDYVPTKKNIIFGHHFTTIAGLGPIVGPAIGVIWGWLPALIWVFFGSIFMGAVHDFSTMIISARHKGKTIGQLIGEVMSPDTRYAMQFIMQFLLFVVLSVFAMIVSTLFIMYPEAVIPVWAQLPIAVWLGWQIRKGKSDLVFSIIALLMMYGTIVIGAFVPVDLTQLGIVQQLAGDGSVKDVAIVLWCVALFIYVFIASTLPVHKLLQPRDYINSHQLIVAMALIIIGLFVAHPPLTAPAINDLAFAPEADVPAIMPLLFIVIACGAISGFHSIASSGTSVKQVDKEEDTLFVGYGSMLTESFLAVLVIIAVAGGLGMGMGEFQGADAFYHHYSSWSAASGLGAKLEAFVVGTSNLLESYGIPAMVGMPMIAVFIVSFANTTLDSAARMQRLSLQEIFTRSNGVVRKPFGNRYFSTFIVVFLAATMAFIKPGGQGAMLLWPLFGSLNQLLGALALGVVSVFLYSKGKNMLYTAIPMLFVLSMTLWAMFQNLIIFEQKGEILLLVITIIIMLLTVWLLVNSIKAIIRRF